MRGAPHPHTPTNPVGIHFSLLSMQAWMGATDHPGAAGCSGGVQIQGTTANTPFDTVLPHLASMLHSHARVHARYTVACVTLAPTDPNFRMPLELASPWAATRGGEGSKAVGNMGTRSQDQ